MRIDSEQLAQYLERGLRPLYTVYGEETLLALEAADRIRRYCRQEGYAEREILTADTGFDWAQLAASGNSLSLFASQRLVELRIPGGKLGNEGGDALRRYAFDLPPDTVTLISLPRLDRTQQSSSWFAALDRAGIVIAANLVTLARLPRWIAKRLSMQNQQADERTLAFLVRRVEGNLLAAHQEVQKLGILFPPGQLDAEQVQSAVLDVARYDVFKLGEAVLAGDATRFVRMLAGLRGEGTAPPLVLWALAEEARALLLVARGLASGKPVAQVMREARVWGLRAELLPPSARRLSTQELEEVLLHAARVDRIIKGLSPGNAWDELLQIGLRLLGPARGTQPNRGRIFAHS